MRAGRLGWSRVSLISVGVAVGALVVLGVLLSTPLRALYHRALMDSALDELYSKPERFSDGFVGYDNQDASSRYEYHRDRLVDIGYFVYEEFSFPDEQTKKIHSQVFKRVNEAFPEHRHAALTWPYNTLQVWDRPQNMPEWRTLVKELRKEFISNSLQAGRNGD